MRAYYFKCEIEQRCVVTSLKAINQGKALDIVYLRYLSRNVTVISEEEFYALIEQCLNDPKTLGGPCIYARRQSILHRRKQRELFPRGG